MDVISIINKVIGIDVALRWFSDKLKSDYGVSDIKVGKTKDGVIMVIKTDEVDKLEKDLNEALARMYNVKKIEVKIE